MIGREELLIWLLNAPYGAGISVDDGGLTLVSDDCDTCIEVGGVPTEENCEPPVDPTQMESLESQGKRREEEFDALVLGMRDSLAELEEVNRLPIERCDDLREWLRKFPETSFKTNWR